MNEHGGRLLCTKWWEGSLRKGLHSAVLVLRHSQGNIVNLLCNMNATCAATSINRMHDRKVCVCSKAILFPHPKMGCISKRYAAPKMTRRGTRNKSPWKHEHWFHKQLTSGRGRIEQLVKGNTLPCTVIDSIQFPFEPLPYVNTAGFPYAPVRHVLNGQDTGHYLLNWPGRVESIHEGRSPNAPVRHVLNGQDTRHYLLNWPGTVESIHEGRSPNAPVRHVLNGQDTGHYLLNWPERVESIHEGISPNTPVRHVLNGQDTGHYLLNWPGTVESIHEGRSPNAPVRHVLNGQDTGHYLLNWPGRVESIHEGRSPDHFPSFEQILCIWPCGVYPTSHE